MFWCDLDEFWPIFRKLWGTWQETHQSHALHHEKQGMATQENQVAYVEELFGAHRSRPLLADGGLPGWQTYHVHPCSNILKPPKKVRI